MSLPNGGKASTSLTSAACSCASALGHLKPRYNLRRVLRIFNIHEDTLHAWLRDGVPLANGRRTRFRYVPIGPRKKEFEVAEVERVFQLMCASTVDHEAGEDADILPFPDPTVTHAESDETHPRRRRAS